MGHGAAAARSATLLISSARLKQLRKCAQAVPTPRRLPPLPATASPDSGTVPATAADPNSNTKPPARRRQWHSSKSRPDTPTAPGSGDSGSASSANGTDGTPSALRQVQRQKRPKQAQKKLTEGQESNAAGEPRRGQPLRQQQPQQQPLRQQPQAQSQPAEQQAGSNEQRQQVLPLKQQQQLKQPWLPTPQPGAAVLPLSRRQQQQQQQRASQQQLQQQRRQQVRQPLPPPPPQRLQQRQQDARQKGVAPQPVATTKQPPGAAPAATPAAQQGRPAPGLQRWPSGSQPDTSASGSGETLQEQRRRLAAAFMQQKLADTLLAGRELLGLPQTRSATVALEQLSQRSDQRVEAALDQANRAVEWQADRRRARQQQQDLLRTRLSNLRSRQQQRLRRQAGNAAVEAVAAAAVGSGRKEGQRPGQQLWEIEAGELLCGLGLSPEDAVEVLLAAYICTQQREAPAEQQQQQQQSGDNSNVRSAATTAQQQQQPEAAGAAAAGAVDSMALLTRCRVEALCKELNATAGVPVAQLGSVLAAAPQLLACTPAEVRKQIGVLASVWRKPRRLTAAVVEHPAMLSPDFSATVSERVGRLTWLGGREVVNGRHARTGS